MQIGPPLASRKLAAPLPPPDPVPRGIAAPRRLDRSQQRPARNESHGAESAALAGQLGLDEREFIERYTRRRPQRDGLALIDKPNGECVFLDGRDCAVQPVKPGQCRGFPNTWNFPGWREVCEAVPII